MPARGLSRTLRQAGYTTDDCVTAAALLDGSDQPPFAAGDRVVAVANGQTWCSGDIMEMVARKSKTGTTPGATQARIRFDEWTEESFKEEVVHANHWNIARYVDVIDVHGRRHASAVQAQQAHPTMSEQSVLGKRKAKTATKARQARCAPVPTPLAPVPAIVHPTKPKAKVRINLIKGFKNLGSEDRIAVQLPCLHVVHLIRGNTIVAGKHVSFGLDPAGCRSCIDETQTVALARGADGGGGMGRDGLPGMEQELTAEAGYQVADEANAMDEAKEPAGGGTPPHGAVNHAGVAGEQHSVLEVAGHDGGGGEWGGGGNEAGGVVAVPQDMNGGHVDLIGSDMERSDDEDAFEAMNQDDFDCFGGAAIYDRMLDRLNVAVTAEHAGAMAEQAETVLKEDSQRLMAVTPAADAEMEALVRVREAATGSLGPHQESMLAPSLMDTPQTPIARPVAQKKVRPPAAAMEALSPEKGMPLPSRRPSTPPSAPLQLPLAQPLPPPPDPPVGKPPPISQDAPSAEPLQAVQGVQQMPDDGQQTPNLLAANRLAGKQDAPYVAPRLSALGTSEQHAAFGSLAQTISTAEGAAGRRIHLSSMMLATSTHAAGPLPMGSGSVRSSPGAGPSSWGSAPSSTRPVPPPSRSMGSKGKAVLRVHEHHRRSALHSSTLDVHKPTSTGHTMLGTYDWASLAHDRSTTIAAYTTHLYSVQGGLPTAREAGELNETRGEHFLNKLRALEYDAFGAFDDQMQTCERLHRLEVWTGTSPHNDDDAMARLNVVLDFVWPPSRRGSPA